ncbi:MAG: signal transduction histidine kinase/response regulator RpfG family c-di-GMP phosphodiesterase [Polyangiales bacterium]|jgi:signal transduction histidine kinase/response regulator RpfG family c-di-GMP phosphodiesterase
MLAEMARTLSVLVLEDDDADAALVELQLRKIDTVRVDVSRATSLREARMMLKAGSYDLVIADLGVPDSSGLATVEGLVDATTPPIIAHSGQADLARRAVNAGADDYVIKGLGPERLADALCYAIARARSRADLRSVIDGNMDAMVVMDTDSHLVLFANPACSAVFGRDADKLVGKPFGYRSSMEKMTELEIQRGGETCTAEMRTTPIEWHGRSALLNCIRDTTERTRAKDYEQRMAHTNRLAAIGQLAASVAHEVNNPAAFILVNLQQMQEQLREIRSELGDTTASVRAGFDECDEMVTDSLEGTMRVASIVKSLRSFARVEGNELEIVDFNELVRLACRMATNEIRHRASLVTDLGVLPPVAAYRAELSQVVLNLLINAAQSIEMGGASKNQIRLSTAYEDGEIVLKVEDSGQGIAAHVLPKVFDPFFTTKERDTGTGLGLAICVETVQKHRGTITVESTEGTGTCFTVTLPTQTDLRPSRVRIKTSEPVNPDRTRVLLVDDDALVRRAFLRIIRAKHDAVEAQSGEEALNYLSSGERFDIILCDLMMPGIDGPALYAAATAMDPALGDLFVFISGGAFSTSTQDFLERMQPLVLEKPISREVLLETVGRPKRQ